MSTYREIVYLCLDNLKLTSDDAIFTEDHITYLLNKFRSFVLKSQYKDIKKEIPESNYQTLCLQLIQVPAIAGEPCEGGTFLRSVEKVPTTISIATPQVHPEIFYHGEIAYVPKERMRYVGYNKWLSNIIYASIGPDNYLYFKSANPQYLNLKSIRFTGIFEEPDKVNSLCDNSNECDPMDFEFPLEEALIPQIVELIVKFIGTGVYKPGDPSNNAEDELSSIYTFLRTNLKSKLQKQIED